MWPDKLGFFLIVGSGHIEFGARAGKHWLADAAYSADLNNDLASLDEVLSRIAHAWQAREVPAKSARSGARLQVLLGGGWFDGGVVPWNPMASTGAALSAYAEGFLQAEGVDLQAGDTVRLADAGYRKPRWAVAYSGEVLQRLNSFAAELGATLGSVQPIASVAAKHCKALAGGSSVLALYEAEATSIWLCQAGSATLLGTVFAEGRSSAEMERDSESLWSRLQLRQHALLTVERVHYLDLTARGDRNAATNRMGDPLPAAGGEQEASLTQAMRLGSMADRSAVAAIGAVPAVSRLQIYVLAGALGVLALLMAVVARIETSKAEIGTQLAALQSRPAPRAEPLSKADQQRVAAANAAIGELNLPVAKLLRAIQPPQDIRVAVLGVEFSPETEAGAGASMKLNAESRSGEEMVRYAAHIADRKPIYDAHLLSHEIAENDAVKPYRFKVEALWKD